jgi:DNA-binding XRE family transcriptional regulator
MDSIVEKIKQVMQQFNLTSSVFADEIGVPRASISHILAGRNKPSLPVLLKITARFPEITMNWLLEGIDNPAAPPPGSQTEENIPQETSTVSPRIPTPVAKSAPKLPGKTVERIVIFYSDRSFSEYRPD